MVSSSLLSCPNPSFSFSFFQDGATFLDGLYQFIWGAPLLILIMGVGIYLTIALKGLQFRELPYALSLAFGLKKAKEGKGDISHFEALMTALAGMIGIGNIAGVATAITVGGLGALFWMWVTGVIGMATKYAESLLALKYRQIDKNGEMAGGPMFFIEHGLKWHWLACSFAIFGAIAAFGGGNLIQANSIADAIHCVFSIPPLYTGIIIALLAGLTIIGGIKNIGRVASFLVPIMALFYVCGSLIIILYHAERIPSTVLTILTHAFSGEAAVGGFLGSSMAVALRTGISRGLMTSEAGLGTASIAAAAAKSDLPGRQAIISMTGSFIATVFLCSVTGLVLGVTNVLGEVDAQGNLITGSALTLLAFTSVISWGGIIVTVGITLFGFTTIIGWAYYGEKCIEYLFGERLIFPYRIFFILIIIPGAVLDLQTVWKVADITNALMAIPNLIGICALSAVVIKENKYFESVLLEERKINL